MDTIFALATARGKAGVAVLRISGPKAFEAAGSLCDLPDDTHKAVLRELRSDGELLDQALVLTFRTPRSFTGEDVVEFHVHGSAAIVSAVLRVLGAIDGLRSAEAGEFTRRALENNRLDLAQVEGLSDLVVAETEAQRRQALRIFAGELGAATEAWRSKLIRAASLLEATIDFVDEDVPVNVMPEVVELLTDVRDSIEIEVAGQSAAERIRDGFEVAIVGPPNVGKSTLLNALAGREAAITSDIAGTTRDVIEVRMDVDGLPVTFLDTAGLRETDDTVESMGVDLARRRASEADIRVILKKRPSDDPTVAPEKDDVILVAKSDVVSNGDISGLSGSGIPNLVAEISSILSMRAAGSGLAIHERHRIEMSAAIEALGIALGRIGSGTDLTEIIAEDVRVAIRALDSLVGRVDVEHLLDEIFANFCIGK